MPNKNDALYGTVGVIAALVTAWFVFRGLYYMAMVLGREF